MNFAIAIMLSLLLVGLPFFIPIFYCKNFSKLEDEEFRKKYDAPYDGLDTRKRSSIAYTVIFIIRRLCFSATCLLLFNYSMI